ncbi:MAG: RibD family protein [Bacteroidota bacterium]
MKSWDSIQLLRRALAECDDLPGSISLKFGTNPEVCLNAVNDADIIIHLNTETDSPFSQDFLEMEFSQKEALDSQEVSLLSLYLPYAFMKHIGKREQKCYSISHFAQTLDGRIATSTGDSKWIGNEDNLLHAHRMRALCDAILVGSKTIEKDNPKLTVRLVSGVDPIRVVMGGNGKLSDSLHHAIDESTIVFRESEQGKGIYDCVVMEKDPHFDLTVVLKRLAERNLHSVYIEGGSYTTSRFLEQNAIDQIQIHFSAKILGSGTNSFGFGQINNISEAITFKQSKFIPVGDEMMFIGNL